MKMPIKKIALAVVALIVIVAAAVYLSFNTIIEHGVETVGSEATQADVELGGSSISLLSGEGTLRGLVVGNPGGFETETAFKLNKISMKVDVASVLSDVVVIEEIIIDSPEITFEQVLKGNNIKTLLKNVQSYAGESRAKAQEEGGGGEKKLQINNLIIKNGKIHISAKAGKKKEATVPLPDIHLKDIGKKEGGKPASEVIADVMKEVNKQVAIAAGTGGFMDKIKGLFGG